MSGLHDAARAIRRTSQDVASRKPETQVAVIRRLEPLQAELTESNILLDEDDMSLSQGVRRYDIDKGLAVNDALVVTPLPNGDWIAHEVQSKNEPSRNLETVESKPKVTGSRGGNAALKSLLEVLEKAGLIKDETTA